MASEKKLPPPLPPAARKPSGEHAAVRTFRGKMESIADGETTSNLLALDQSLDRYLSEMRSEAPPPEDVIQPRPSRAPFSCEPLEGREGSCSRGTPGCNVAHDLENTKVTIKMEPVCEHGQNPERCEACARR